jgi:dihydroxy-acid dehydratase
MKKAKSAPIFDDKDYPISAVRMGIFNGTGVDLDQAKKKPIIGIANSQTDINPGHLHLGELAVRVKEGVYTAGGIPFEFNVPAPCDGLAEGHDGMRHVLAQRDLIADTVETHARSMCYDALVMIASCDKIVPGMLMAAARLDIPTIFLTGGPSAFNIRWMPEKTDSVFFGDYEDPNLKWNCTTSSSCGACEVMGTANTFQCLAETMGMTLPGTANIPGFFSDKKKVARATGERIVEMLDEGLTARKLLTRQSLENAIMVSMAIGGSTNTTLHIPALANELGLEMSVETFNEFNTKIPTLCAISPNGPHGVIDLYMAGGVPAVMKQIETELHLDCLTSVNQSWGELLKTAVVKDANVIRSKETCYDDQGGLVALFGNLAPEGAIIKQSAVSKDMHVFTGTAHVLESEHDALVAFREGKVLPGSVLVIRNEGPKGGPGMPETLAVTMALVTSGLKDVALITDGRFSGGSSGPCVGHISPEAYAGGPIAAVRDGDKISIDIPGRKLEIDLTDAEIAERLKDYQPQQREIPAGYMKRYIKMVGSAAKGAVLD